jgi:hypothetical protein
MVDGREWTVDGDLRVLVKKGLEFDFRILLKFRVFKKSIFPKLYLL